MFVHPLSLSITAAPRSTCWRRYRHSHLASENDDPDDQILINAARVSRWQRKWEDVANVCLYTCIDTSLMHYLPSVYSVTITLHVSRLQVAHHQQETMYMYIQQLVRVVRFSWMSGLRESTKTYTDVYWLLHIYIVTSRWWATRKPETRCGIVTE
jgi:hypothetical protein